MGGCLRAVIAAAVLLLLLLAHWAGQLTDLTRFALPMLATAGLVDRVWGAVRGALVYRFGWQFWRSEYRSYRRQYLNRALFYLLLAVCEALAVPRGLLATGDYAAIQTIFIWAPAIGLLVLELFPRKEVHRPWNLLLLGGSLFLMLQLSRTFLAPIWSEKVVLAPPFRGEWVVFHGGRSTFFNHHYSADAQRHAIDFVAIEDGREWRGDPDKLPAYVAFGQPLFAPADGQVVQVEEGRRDVPIGQSDWFHAVGNYVVIQIAEDKYVLMAHLMRNSVRVREGQRVQAGRLIGLCGNSGNTSQPHLHIQVQNRANWKADDLTTYPLEFRGIRHRRWGINWSEQQGELMRNDVVTVPRRQRR